MAFESDSAKSDENKRKHGIDFEEARTPGEEGLQDQVLVTAIYESARIGQPVALPAVSAVDAFRRSPPVSG